MSSMGVSVEGSLDVTDKSHPDSLTLSMTANNKTIKDRLCQIYCGNSCHRMT